MKLLVKWLGLLAIFAALTGFIADAAYAQDEVIAKGSFVGKTGHKASGMMSLVKTDNGVEIRFGPNFSIKGAPGPYLGFGKDGKYVKATQFSKLLKTTGAQTYKVPASIDVSEFNEFYVWCKPFNVPLALAKLTK